MPAAPLDVVVAVLQQLLDDVLDVLADVAGFGQRGRVGDHERHVEQPGVCASSVLPVPVGADQQDVALGEPRPRPRPWLTRAACSGLDRHRQGALGRILADHVLVEDQA